MDYWSREEDACRHRFQCRNCKKYFCADDIFHEGMSCEVCYDDLDLCPRCNGHLPGISIICKYHWQNRKCRDLSDYKRIQKCLDNRKCQTCYRVKRRFHFGKKRCISCIKRTNEISPYNYYPYIFDESNVPSVEG